MIDKPEINYNLELQIFLLYIKDYDLISFFECSR